MDKKENHCFLMSEVVNPQSKRTGHRMEWRGVPRGREAPENTDLTHAKNKKPTQVNCCF